MREGEPARTEASVVTHVRIKYAYLRALPTPAKIAARLGPALDFDIQQNDWAYHPYTVPAYFGAFGLDLRAELELAPTPKHRVLLAASLPAFAWVSQSAYALHDDAYIYANRDHNGAKTFFRYLAQGELQTWNRHQGARLDLRYQFQLAPHWALSAGLHARLLAHQTPRSLLAQEYGSTLALTWII